jgi:predicted amino acid dehydrogenase
VARDEHKLADLKARLTPRASANILTSTSMDRLAEAQLILTVTSALHDVIPVERLCPGSVVCDVARPRDVSAIIAAARDDILVIDGGMVDVPGPVDFHFNFGFPPGKAYACMAETMILALEGRFEDYTLGKDISLERVNEITGMARKHGFRLSGFRSFEHEVTDEQIEMVRRNARARRAA